ncbi:hypothetical protein Glove_99g132 [Diversispora epigaea]|uniref:Uncharacterized protein n=1 Tax=Diversispora epigaea TaxID=1348612 RepID=A0A397J7N1_9GLOM|nr:hypothetical protein Glove_99g132 [Diversispora epigaea]
MSKVEINEVRKFKTFLTNVNKIKINDKNLHKKIIEALKNVLKICLIYRLGKQNSIVQRYMGYIKGIKDANDPNNFVINIAVKYFQEIEERNTFKEKPYLNRIIMNVKEIYHEIAKQNTDDDYLGSRVNSMLEEYFKEN